MDLYVVCDFSVSAVQSPDVTKCTKVERALRITEKFVEEVDKEEVSVHLIVMIGKPALVKSYVQDAAEVRSLVENEISTDISTCSSDYGALRELILSHRNESNYEVLILTDLSENSNPQELLLPCLLRFVILTDPAVESLSEYLVANLECISMKCALEGGMTTQFDKLNVEKHFPIIFDAAKTPDSMAIELAREVRTVKEVSITISPSVSLKADLSPGLFKTLCVIDDEIGYREIGRDQSPTFKLVGSVETNMIVKNTMTTDLIHCVTPSKLTDGHEENVELFQVVTEALVNSHRTLILLHSSGEECFLRAYNKLDAKPEDAEHGLVLQFYCAQSVIWKQHVDPPSTRNKWEFSYGRNQTQIYWSHGYDLQQEANKAVRRLKKENASSCPIQFYEEIMRIATFAATMTLDEFAVPYAEFMQTKAEELQIGTNPHLLTVIRWLRSPAGFNTAVAQFQEHMNEIQVGAK